MLSELRQAFIFVTMDQLCETLIWRLQGCKNSKSEFDLLALRANIQVNMRQFEDAFSSLSEARQLSYRLGIEEFHDPWGYIGSTYRR